MGLNMMSQDLVGSFSKFRFGFVDTWCLFDIIYNMLTQQRISDEEHTITIRDSIKYYFRKGFWIDFLSILYFLLQPTIFDKE